jgi:hypothetical protein
MKKIIFTLLVASAASQVLAQQDDQSNHESHRSKREHQYSKSPLLYIGTSTGINNNTGLIGVNVDVPIIDQVTVEGGVGISSWGTKVEVCGKYYLDSYRQGWAFGGGITHNSGLSNYTSSLETIYGTTEQVTLDLHPQTNLFLAAFRYWHLGHKANRVFLELGYSARLTGSNRFDQTTGDEISSRSTAVMNLISPGGVIIGFGFSFGIY